MSTPLTVNGTTYNFPTSGEDPNWAIELVGWAEQITISVNSLSGTGDISESSFTIANNTAAAANINGLQLTGATVKSAIINYTIYRKSNATPSGNSETGIILATYDDVASSGSIWTIAQQAVGNAGVVLSVTDLGQFQYISSDISATGYSGTMVFSAKILNR